MSTLQVENVVSPQGGLPANLKPVTAKAWVNFNGTGSVTINDSYNVVGVTDEATGQYRVVFDNQPSTDNYAWSYGCDESFADLSAKTVSYIGVITRNVTSGNPADDSDVSVTIFGGDA